MTGEYLGITVSVTIFKKRRKRKHLEDQDDAYINLTSCRSVLTELKTSVHQHVSLLFYHCAMDADNHTVLVRSLMVSGFGVSRDMKCSVHDLGVMVLNLGR